MDTVDTKTEAPGESMISSPLEGTGIAVIFRRHLYAAENCKIKNLVWYQTELSGIPLHSSIYQNHFSAQQIDFLRCIV